MMLTTLRNSVVCSQSDLPCLLTNIPDPLLCDCLCTQLVVLWLFMRPKEVFHTTKITNLTVPLSITCLHWSLWVTWPEWCQLTFFLSFFFFNFLKSCPTHSTCPPRGCARQPWRLLREGKEKWLTGPCAAGGRAELVQRCLFCCLWFLELLIILIGISLLLIQ